METEKVKINDYKILTAFALFWVFLGWLGFFSALAGFFYSWIFIGYSILGIICAIHYTSALPFNLIRLNGKSLLPADSPHPAQIRKLNKLSSEFYSVALALLVIVISFSFFTVPTIFSGRDQGSISEAGIRLAQNHQLKFSTSASQEFFKIYGPGKALNFPGFHYTQNGELITQFPIPYIAWLGIFYSIFGLVGFIIANAVLFYLFLFSSYFLFRLFAPIKYAVIFLLLILTSFSFSWFLKFTLSENMALALVWLGILQLALFFKEKSGLSFFSLLAVFGLLAFARIEGIAMLAMLIVIMLFNKDARNFLTADKMKLHGLTPGTFLRSGFCGVKPRTVRLWWTGAWVKRIILPTLFFAVIFILNFITDFSFFKEIAKAVLKNSTQVIETGSLLNTINVFLLYGIAPYLIFGTIGIIYFLRRKARLELLPFILILPLFFYLASPHISSDHPWMLRRYLFAVLPVLIFYTVLWLAHYFREKKKYFLRAIIIALVLISLPAFLKYFAFAENKNLLTQTKNLSQNFSDNDLVLVDRLVSGGGWSMISGPMSFLYGKNAVYFFNPEDLAKLDLEKFDKIYLITPNKKISFYKNGTLRNRLDFFKNYRIETSRLEVFNKSAKNISLPEKKKIKIEGKILEIRK